MNSKVEYRKKVKRANLSKEGKMMNEMKFFKKRRQKVDTKILQIKK